MRTVIPKNARLVPPESKRVFRGEIYDVYQWPQKMYDGSTSTFEMLKRPDTIVVMGIDRDKIIVLEERQPNTDWFYGLPGGRHDYDAETELEAAKREMLEETGVTFKNWRLVSVTQSHGKIDWFLYLFVAWDLSGVHEQHLDSGEQVKVLRLGLSEIKELITNPKTRWLPQEILESAHSVQDLVDLPEFEGKPA
jgi:ADP-ribose pyrophosphatase